MEKLRLDYIRFMENSAYCISLEMCRFLYDFVREKRIKSVIDLGSGLSTAVFVYAGCKVRSYDDDRRFRDRTARFLFERGITKGVEFKPFSPDISEQVKLVFYDLGHYQTRVDNFLLPLKLSTQFVVYDDMDNPDYQAILVRKGIKWSVIKETKDPRGRYGGLVRLSPRP